MIACASIKAVSERSLILSRRYLLDVIMDPFIRLADKDEKVGLAVTEQVLDFLTFNVLQVGNINIFQKFAYFFSA